MAGYSLEAKTLQFVFGNEVELIQRLLLKATLMPFGLYAFSQPPVPQSLEPTAANTAGQTE
jgi:hypothetical protein